MMTVDRHLTAEERAERAILYCGQTRRGGNRRAWKRLCKRRAAFWQRVQARLNRRRNIRLKVTDGSGHVRVGIVHLPLAGRPSLPKHRTVFRGAKHVRRSRWATKHGGIQCPETGTANTAPTSVG